jgi:hypothetical protein
MNAPEVNSFVNVVNELSKTNKDNVSARIAKRLSTHVLWPPTMIESHTQIRSYQKWLETNFPGRINRGGLGHLWSEAYKRTEETPQKKDSQQIDIEEQIAAQAAEMIAPVKAYSKAANRAYCHYTRAETMAIKNMVAEGANDAEIGESLGRSEKGIKHKRQQMNLNTRNYKCWSEAEDVALEALVLKGYKHQQIADKMGRTYASIQQRTKTLGLTYGKRGRLALKPAPQPTPPPAPPVQPAPVKPLVDPTPMTKSLPWWRRIFG